MKHLQDIFMTLEDWEGEEISSYYDFSDLFSRSELECSGSKWSSSEMAGKIIAYEGGLADLYDVSRLLRLCWFVEV